MSLCHLITFRKFIFTLFFIIFLYPISAGGLSVNYSFLLLPLFYMLIYLKVRKPAKSLLFIIGFFTLIFIGAYVCQHEFFDEVKRLTSFAVFMSMFSYMFIKIDQEMIESFKASVVGVGLYFSLISICTYFTLSASDMGSAKDLVGGQRFGFIYILGIWMTYYYQSDSKLLAAIKYSVLCILILGVLLTFSRASVVALFASVILFMLGIFSRYLGRPDLRFVMRSLLVTAILTILSLSLYKLVPDVFNFFDARLFSFALDTSAVADNLANSETSEGTRVYILARIMDFIMHNPLTGSGYLGVWILSDSLFGSAHNQYADVLFRTGVLGFLAYMYLILNLQKYLYSNDKALFWGVVGVLFYGLFHETFKESQGGFVLAFLLGMMSQTLSNQANKPDVAGV